MKRDFDNLDLRAAFRAEPESCHRALMDAARSVREERQTVKRYSFKTLIIAVVVVLSMLTTAFAASELLGWTDYFAVQWGIHTTPGMQNAMQMEPKTYEVGPLTFTVQEAVSDNRFALISTHIATTDGSPALMSIFADDPVGAYGDRSRMLMKTLGLEDKSQPCFEAAAQKGIPMYSVRAIIEVDEQYNGGEGMEDILWDEKTNVTYLSMHSLNTEKVGVELPVTVFLRVAQHDETGEEIQKWTTRETLTIPVGQLLDKKHYAPEKPFTVNGAELECINAELYITGAYLHCQWKMPDGVVNDDNFSMWDYHNDDLLLTDGTFNAFEGGISLSGGYDATHWPIVKVEEMINVDALPEVIRVSDGTNDISYK